MRFPALTYIGLLVCTCAWAQEDLTGLAGVSTDTRVMVIFDNSRSMQLTPDGTGNLKQVASHDLDPATLVNGVCDPSNPPAQCANKWCLGKCVMHNLLEPYENLMEVGFATYYGYYKKETAWYSGNVPHSYCHYDVVAGPGERVGQKQLLEPQSTVANDVFWSTDSQLDTPGKCTITNDTTEAFRNASYSSARHCSPTRGVPEPARACFPVDSSRWFERSENQLVRYSPQLPGLTPPLWPMWKNGVRNPGPPESFTSYIFDSSVPGAMPGIRYYLYSQNTEKNFGKEQKEACSPVGTKRTFTDTFSGCRPDNPCFMTLYAWTADYKVKETFYDDRGPTWDGWTFLSTSREILTLGEGTIQEEETCPAQMTLTNGYGCTPSKPCALTNGHKQTHQDVNVYTIERDSPSEVMFNGRLYSCVGDCQFQQFVGRKTYSDTSDLSVCVAPENGSVKASVQVGTETFVEKAASAGQCPAAPYGYAYHSTYEKPLATGSFTAQPENNRCPSGCTASKVEQIEGVTVIEECRCASVQTECRYVKRTQPSVTCDYYKTRYRLQTTEPKTWYSCGYTRTRYLYGRDYTYNCRYERDRYLWRPKTHAYRWETIGGEVIGSFAYEVAKGRDLCDEYNSTLQEKCPAVTRSALYHPACSLPGRSCRLRWRGYEGWVDKGRLANSRADDTLPKYCRAADEGGVPFSPIARDTLPDWCEAKLSPGTGEVVDQFLMSDPYSPTLNASNPKMVIGSEATLGGKLIRVQYSLDGSQWTDSPPMSSKQAGWSRTPLTTGAQTALAFLPFHRANLPLIQKYMEMPGPQNPKGLQMPSRARPHRVRPETVAVTGFNTPLYGALSNVRDYLRDEILPKDDVAMCRNYAVVLVTDGDEFQDNVQVQYPSQKGFDQFGSTDLVQLIADLRDVSAGQRKPRDGVKTFIVGFGSQVLKPGVLDAMAREAGTDVGGKAFVAMSAMELSNHLRGVFDYVAQNTYSRSKPVITLSRDKLYVGSFRITGDGYEWDGFLNAYDLDGRKIQQKPRFEFHEKLNEQKPSSRRIYTFIKNKPLELVNGLGGSLAAELYGAMGVNAQTGRDIVRFLLNEDLKAPFVGYPRATKESRLSDIYHSTPVLVGPPSFPTSWAGPNDADMKGYEAFKARHVARPERLYVGSNTGMVHAICEQGSSQKKADCGASTSGIGSEVFALIPPSVLPKLDSTRRGRKADNFTVDGSFGAADVCLQADCSKADGWRTLLLGSYHKGGNSVFAVDVTNANQPALMWETSDALLGETWSPPTVVKTRLKKGPTWVGILGGGYSSPAKNSSAVSNSVLLLNLADGKVLADESQYPVKRAAYRVDSNPASCDTKPETCVLPRNSVPGRIATWLPKGGGAYVNKAFFGDTQGRMWSMHFHGGLADWAPQVLFDPTRADCARDSQGHPVRIVDALDDGKVVGVLPFSKVTDARPIFQRVMVGTTAKREALVFAGTGDVNDPNFVGKKGQTSDFDHFYGVRSGSHWGACQGTPLFVKRFAPGEKVLSEGTVALNVVFVPTYRPPSITTQQNADVCSVRGDARIYAYVQSSGRPAPVFPDANSPSQAGRAVLELPNEGYISDLIYVPDSTNISRGTLVYATDDGTPKAVAVEGLPREVPVYSWRRIH